MHGLIFTSLRDYTVELVGAEQAAELWADRVFEPTEAYDDEWFVAQLERLASTTSESRATVERGFGAYAARETFADLYPGYYDESADVFEFLLGIEEKIHGLVRTTVPGARPPHLNVQPLGDTAVIVSYTSERKLCNLLEGLVRGAAARLRQTVDVEQIQCMHRGDPGCVFTVTPVAA